MLETLKGAFAYRATTREVAAPILPVPEGFTVGRPFATLKTGQCRKRWSGEEYGPQITRQHLEDMLRLLLNRSDKDPVIIDWNHGSSPGEGASENPDTAASLGVLVGGWIEEALDGGHLLVVVPAYNEGGVSVVERNKGALWNSPEFIVCPVYDREGEKPNQIGSAQLLAVALTNRPAQVATTAEAVALTEGSNPMLEEEKDTAAVVEAEESPVAEAEESGEMVPMEEHLAALAAKDDEIMRLKAELEAAKMPKEDAPAEDKAEYREAITREIANLRAELAAERGKREAAEDDSHFQTLLSEGRVTPAERDNLFRALSERREGRPWFYEAVFATRAPHAAVDYTERGHGASSAPSVEETEEVKLHREIVKFREAHGLPNYQSAMAGYLRSIKVEG